MRSGTKVTLTFSDEALTALNALASDRKRGELVSKLVIQARRAGGVMQDGILERIEQRLQRIEEKIGA
jgi:hypothetical protein